MGLFSSIFGGGGSSSTSSTQKTQVDNTNNNYIDIHFEELAEVEARKLDLNNSIFAYAKKIEEQNLSQEEKDRLKNESIKKIELLQTQKQIDMSEKNTKITVVVTVIGLSLTAYQIFKKGKK
jgi:hypothetical protein